VSDHAARRPARAVFFGSGSFGVPILDAVARSVEVELVGVVSVPDRTAGRRQILTSVPVVARARELGLDVVQPPSLRTPEGRVAVGELRAEVGVLADFGRIVPEALLDATPLGILNVHPSLLPRHRGATPVAAAILAGDRETGVTVIRMDAGVDTGPILAAEAWRLDGTETAPAVETEAALRGAALIARTLGPWLRGELVAHPQDDGLATTTRPLTRDDGRLDPEASVVELERRVRALQPWPGTWIDTVAGRLAVWRASALPGRADGEPGLLDERGLQARDGYLVLDEVQPAGGRRMDFRAFLRGRPTVASTPMSLPDTSSVTARTPGQSAGRRPEPGVQGIAGLTPAQLEAWFVARGEPGYRGQQVLAAVWRGAAASFDDVQTLPQPLRRALDDAFVFDTAENTEVQLSDGGLTEKGLHRLADGALVESVLMHYPPRAGARARTTLCISSQAGCAVGCPFCATGELGFTRDLTTAEIVDQVRHAARRLAVDGRLTNVVFMGMGEPLLNLDNVLAAVQALSDPARFALGARHVTVSTSGVVPGIERLTALGPQFTLAISLHAARDPLRDVLVPLNRRWPVAEVVRAARDHARSTGRRITYEVTMISGINDTPHDAEALARLLAGDHAHVNLIPMNPVAHTPWRASDMSVIERFAATLRATGISTTIRRNRGQEIGAACGQLAAERAGEPPAAAVARRRERLVRESAAGLRGERSRDALPAGVDAR
jgi:23S rRNA (adenine2503-C2)-methyltransferase